MFDNEESRRLDRLAERLMGLPTAEARALADAEGARLFVREEYGVLYQDDFRPGRITVWAFEGVVTRAYRG